MLNPFRRRKPDTPTAPPSAPEPTPLQAVAFAAVLAAVRKATRGEKASVSSLSGAERRRVRRILERRERRLAGKHPVGATASSMSRRPTAVSGYHAELRGEEMGMVYGRDAA